MRLLLLVPVLSGALLQSSLAEVSQVATPILSLPATIKKPGVYTIKKDLNFKAATGAAITIASDNVTLDLGGRTISNTPPAAPASQNTATLTAAVGVASIGPVNITVRNGRISGFSDGVSLGAENPGEIVAEHLHVANCNHTGIQIQADRVEVRDCRLRNIGDVAAPGNVWGILVSSNSASVSDNEVYSVICNTSAPRGIQVTSQALGSVTGNHVANPSAVAGGFGIICFSSSNPNSSHLLVGNFAANWSIGIAYANGAPGKYKDNLTSNCATPFQGGTAVGTNN